MPQVPTTISQTVEQPLSASNFTQFRSLQRGTTGVASQAWQESATSTFRPNAQFRSLQRGGAAAGSGAQFRSVKIQDQRSGAVPVDSMYSSNDNERQLYAVTEL